MNSAPFPFCGAVEKLRGLVHSPIDDDDGAANERNANFLPVSLQVMADIERNIAKFLFQGKELYLEPTSCGLRVAVKCGSIFSRRRVGSRLGVKRQSCMGDGRLFLTASTSGLK